MVLLFRNMSDKMKLCIFGSGGFAKEVYWLAKQCGREVAAFIDLQYGGSYGSIKIESEEYFNLTKHSAIVGVGDPTLRKKITNKILDKYGYDVFDTLIAPSANLMSNNIQIGKGSVICANCIITCDVRLGDFTQLNLATTIGHDTQTGQFFTTAPGVHISGKVSVGECVYFGTNASSIEEISICDNVIIGAGACVAKNITESGTYVGIPAKKLEKR
jgi:sugar O-acyltransferase (sialic acid O-acetyltransferase NeuD family)